MIGKSNILPVQNFSGGQKILKRTKILSFFAHFGSKIFTLRTETFRMCCRICVVRYQQKNLEDEIPGTKIPWKFFRFWTGNFQTFIHFLSTCNSLSSIFTSRAICWCPKLFEGQEFFSFRSLSKKLCHFGRHCWGSTLRSAVYVLRQKLWKILFLKKYNFLLCLKFRRKKLVNWVKKFSSLLKTALYLCRSLSISFLSKFL